jgi:hypothetical protein
MSDGRGIEPGRTRASGETAADEEARAEAQEMTEPPDTDVLDEERRRTFRNPGFARMRTDWNSADREVIRHAQDIVHGRIIANFQDAYQVMFEIYDLVRTPATDADGVVQTDQYGFTIWKRTSTGSYEEDWSRLTGRERQNFLFTITTHLFEWEQRAADAWGEAMFAKAQFEEQFALGFEAVQGKATVDDRRARGNLASRDERYFAIFLTLYSKKAEAVVRTMGLLGQRLKDSMGA